jgi:hypothetical protein
MRQRIANGQAHPSAASSAAPANAEAINSNSTEIHLPTQRAWDNATKGTDRCAAMEQPFLSSASGPIAKDLFLSTEAASQPVQTTLTDRLIATIKIVEPGALQHIFRPLTVLLDLLSIARLAGHSVVQREKGIEIVIDLTTLSAGSLRMIQTFIVNRKAARGKKLKLRQH